MNVPAEGCLRLLRVSEEAGVSAMNELTSDAGTSRRGVERLLRDARAARANGVA